MALAVVFRWVESTSQEGRSPLCSGLNTDDSHGPSGLDITAMSFWPSKLGPLPHTYIKQVSKEAQSTCFMPAGVHCVYSIKWIINFFSTAQPNHCCTTLDQHTETISRYAKHTRCPIFHPPRTSSTAHAVSFVSSHWSPIR